ncbi:polyketide synthase [Dactylonectria estremocensis]|uniref:Polyketide synthase n=1 Tax=Dactylonectria estremocensis TaxID=1079267 RepID=A0A9P9DGF4_9HYPO|nr:polyketide synthase [Dactylonectria estremocensis]
MAPTTLPRPAVSAAIFSPQNNTPKPQYLAYIRSRLLEDSRLKPLKDAIVTLPQTWDSLASWRQEMGSLQNARQRVQGLAQWLETGISEAVEPDTSGLVTLPLLTIIHMVQYLDYLRQRGHTHSECLDSLKDGGVQGYCIGLLSAVVVATSTDEEELLNRAAAGIRVALAIGAFGDFAEAVSGTEWTTLAIRLRHGDDTEEKELLRRFSGAYISTISDSNNRSIIASDGQIAALRAYAEQEGLSPKTMHIRGKLHDPNNATLAKECIEWCNTLDELSFPSGEAVRLPVRSNRTGETLSAVAHSLSDEVIQTILASTCDWSLVIRGLASDLQQTHRREHTLALFGIGNSVPLAPFRQQELDITKLDMSSASTTSTAAPNLISFPPNAIAVVGAGCRLPGASSLEELWELISEGRSRLETLRSDRANIQGSYRASQDKNWASRRQFFGNYIDDIDAFDHSFFGISPREAKYMDPQQRLLLAVAFDAMDSSGYMRNHRRERGEAVGCFIGASYTEYLENTSSYIPSAFTATGTIRAFLSGKISYHFGWSGPSEVIDTACSSSIVAVHRACQAINSGECSTALAGGVNLITGINNYFDLGKASFLSQTGQCKPFDDSADGYCRADGVGLVVLKPLSKAIADGDHIMGVILATATNQGGIDAPGITVPDGSAQRALYQNVLLKSGIKGHQVSYVEAHGTGTQVGDPIEVKSIRDVFGGLTRTNPVYLGSLKANIGHSETAAGVASLLKVLTMFHHQGIPPLQGFKSLNHKIPALEPDGILISTSLIPWDMNAPRIAAVNSYGASGSNSALLCSEWLRETGKSVSKHAPAFPILLSAASPESLRRYTDDLASYLLKSSAADLRLGDLALTLSERRKHHRTRWSITASSLPDLVSQLQKKIPKEFVEIPKTPKKVVLTFSGQSRTSIGLDPSVRQWYPLFDKYITQCNDILQGFGCPNILPALSDPGPIINPVILQCGTVSVQYACAQCWIDGGLQVDAVVGHSLGELTALAVSGVLTLSDALKVVYTRAELINEKWGPERGTMLAIHAPLEVVQSIMEVVETLVSENDDALEIACYNSVSSHIVVGQEAWIAMAEKILQQDAKYQGIRFQRLSVSHGFHSRFTEPLLSDLVDLEKTLEFKEATIPFETSTQTPFIFGTKDSTYLADHARDPVHFVNAIHRVEQQLGPCVWLEAGWGSPIVAMAKKAVVDPKLHTFQAVTALATVAANLWREGITITDWSFLTSKDSGLGPIWLPPYNFDQPKAWLDHVDNAIEEQKKTPSLQLTKGNSNTQLLSNKGVVGSDGSSHNFTLHTNTERFTKIVQGHAVRRKPLCPASMYMEAAVMGTDKLGVELRSKTITFRNVTFARPLGCGEDLDVELSLGKIPSSGDESWHYAVQSTSKSAYSEGDISVSSSPPDDMELYGMLVSDGITALKNDPDTEKLRKNTVYSLFSKIVEYSDLLRGIMSITLGQKQALAQIQVPKSTFATSESTVSDYYDAITLDTFVQVLGLLINCNNASDSGNEIYIASCIDKMVVSPTDFQKPQTWTVYATYSVADSKTLSGSVFVFSEEGKLTAFGTKIQFMRTEAARLERVLQAVNPRPAVRDALPLSTGIAIPARGQQVDFALVNPKISIHAPSPTSASVALEGEVGKIGMLKSLIAAYSGVKEADIQDDVSFASMGLDSLASMELASEIESTLGIRVNSEDLLTGDIRSLLKCLPMESRSQSLENASRSSDKSTASNGTSIDGDRDDPTAMSTPPDLGFQTNDNEILGKSTPWTRPSTPLNTRFKIETVTYKEVDGVKIPADLYIPSEAPSQPMPIALMIHGGGHLTLSRRAVRPAQTAFLLQNGLFPVSVDYRLAPHVNVLDGSMTDTRDACIWARRDLPKIMALKGITLDPTKLVVIGWSTGGTLAMTTSWTLQDFGHSPPLAVLSFYCPVEYDPDAPITMGHDHPPRTMSLSEIRSCLPPGASTSHAFNTLDTTKLGWLDEGDPRSELVLALIKEENGMSLLFNGLPTEGEELSRANAQRAAAFSPLTQARNGNYSTPTYLIFGDEDEIAPYEKAVEFEEVLTYNAVPCGFLHVTGAKHIFDLGLAPGSEGWDIGVGPGYDFLIRQIEHARC